MGTFQALADLVIGAACHCCGAAGSALCRNCGEKLLADNAAKVHRGLAGFPETLAGGLYQTERKQAILALKEHQALALALPLGASLALTVAQLAHRNGAQQIALLPAPSASATVRKRGTDTMALLAKRARLFLRGAGIDCVVMPDAKLVTAGADQGGLDREARLRNLQGRIVVEPRCVARPVILVDDIVTTGATLCELSRATHKAGLDILGAAALAAAGWR